MFLEEMGGRLSWTYRGGKWRLSPKALVSVESNGCVAGMARWIGIGWVDSKGLEGLHCHSGGRGAKEVARARHTYIARTELRLHVILSWSLSFNEHTYKPQLDSQLYSRLYSAECQYRDIIEGRWCTAGLLKLGITLFTPPLEVQEPMVGLHPSTGLISASQIDTSPPLAEQRGQVLILL
jgi:hypothetical protein